MHMKVNNILCSELTQLAINKEYNKIWEHPKMQTVINTTINKVLGNAKKIDRNVTLDDITSGVYVRLADLIDRYSPVLKDGSYIEFFPYIYKYCSCIWRFIFWKLYKKSIYFLLFIK